MCIRDRTKELGLLLIFDEIQTGMGRTGKLFHYEHAGIEPDIMTLGKGIGGGVPLAALLATDKASRFQPGDPGGQVHGQPLVGRVGRPGFGGGGVHPLSGACAERRRCRGGVPRLPVRVAAGRRAPGRQSGRCGRLTGSPLKPPAASVR